MVFFHCRVLVVLGKIALCVAQCAGGVRLAICMSILSGVMMIVRTKCANYF